MRSIVPERHAGYGGLVERGCYERDTPLGGTVSRFIISSMATHTNSAPKIHRDGEWATINIGNNVHVSLHVEALRDLCNDIAAVLDDWFEERDRNGRA